MATFPEGQVIPMAQINAYPICAAGKRLSITVRMNSGVSNRLWFSREATDAEGSLRLKSNYSEEYVSVPVAEITPIPGIPVDVFTNGDMITGDITFTAHVDPELEP